MTINMDSALTDDGMSAQFLWQITVLSLFKNTGIGDVFSLARAWAFSYIVPRLIQCINGGPGSVPRNRAIAWPAGPTNTWPSGGRATTLPHNHAAAQAASCVDGRPAAPALHSGSSYHCAARARASVGVGRGRGAQRAPAPAQGYLRARPAPFLRSHRPAPHPVSGGSLLASARPAPCLYSHRPALQWGGGGKVVCINIICDTDKLTSGVKGPEFDSRSPP